MSAYVTDRLECGEVRGRSKLRYGSGGQQECGGGATVVEKFLVRTVSVWTCLSEGPLFIVSG